MPEAQPAGEGPTETRRMQRAIREIRREGWKVAVIYATLDAALVTLVSNLVVAVARPAVVPARVPLPGAVVDGLARVGGVTLAEPAVGGGVVVGLALGVVVFGLEVALRVRRPLVEQFESVNPRLHESLRTARDAVADGRRTRMARRLYEEVLAELRESSSLGLLDLRRLTATVLVIALVSLASIQVAVLDLSLGGGAGPDEAAPDGGEPAEYGGLQDPSSILGDPEDVPAGQENLDAIIDTAGSGGQGGGVDSAAAYDDSGFVGPEAVEGQRAGFAEGEQLEDAELIREYNLRIREGADG